MSIIYSKFAFLVLFSVAILGDAEAQTPRLSGRVCVTVLKARDVNTREWIQLFKMQTVSDRMSVLSIREVELHFKYFQPTQFAALRDRCTATDPMATLPAPPPKRPDFPPTEVDHVHACVQIFYLASQQKGLGPDEKSALSDLAKRATALDDLYYLNGVLSTRDATFWRQHGIQTLTKYRGEVIRYCASY